MNIAGTQERSTIFLRLFCRIETDNEILIRLRSPAVPSTFRLSGSNRVRQRYLMTDKSVLRESIVYARSALVASTTTGYHSRGKKMRLL